MLGAQLFRGVIKYFELFKIGWWITMLDYMKSFLGQRTDYSIYSTLDFTVL